MIDASRALSRNSHAARQNITLLYRQHGTSGLFQNHSPQTRAHNGSPQNCSGRVGAAHVSGLSSISSAFACFRSATDSGFTGTRCSGSGNPENPIKNKTVIGGFAAISAVCRKGETLKECPFLVGHQVSCQDGLCRRHQLESCQSPDVDPFCQNELKPVGAQVGYPLDFRQNTNFLRLFLKA